MAEIRDELVTLFSKLWTWICLIFLGMVGMFSHNLYIGRKMTFKEAIGAFGISFFVGALVSIWCYYAEWERVSMWLVPFSTLLADKLMMAVMAYNWQRNIRDGITDFLKGIINKLKP